MKIAFVILCLALTGCGQPTGRYQVVSSGNEGSAWKIDTVSGAIWFCEDVSAGPATAVECTPGVQR